MPEQTQTLVSNSSGQIFEKIAKFSIYLLVFLLPIFFLPWTTNVLDFNKQALLTLLVFIALISWTIRILLSRKLEINLHLFSIPVLILLVTAGLSTIFSYWTYGSFWGWPLQTSESFLSLLGVVLLFFLVINIFQEKKEVLRLLIVLASSSVLVALYGIFQIFGKFLVPFNFAQTTSFNTISTVNGLSVFLAGILPFLIILTVLLKRFLRFFFGVGLILSLIILVLVGFQVSWWMVIAGMIFLFVFFASRRGMDFRWLTIPMLILAIAILFGVFKISVGPIASLDTLEVSPSQTASFDIAKQSLKERPILGSGPGTFIYDYAQFKSETLNQTAFWNVNFGSSASKMIDILSTYGILGIMAMLFTLLGLGYFGFTFIRETGENQFFPILSLGVLASWLGFMVGSFLYPFSLSIEFVWWLMMAGFIGLSFQKIKSFELKPSSYLTMGVSLVLMLTFLFGIGILFLEGQRYLANVRYSQGLLALNEGRTDEAITKVRSAINLDSKTDNYWRNLSQIYSVRLNEELQRQDISQEELNQNVQIFISNAVNMAKAATDLNPRNFANWTVRGNIYRDLIGITTGTEDWAIKAYEESEKLQPTNPFVPTQKGLIYIQTGELDKALEEFKKAIALKPDYAPAHFQIAVIYQLQGKAEEMINKLEETKAIAPFDVGLAFQLGLVYYQNEQYDKAKSELERGVSMSPNYSNARYFLGLIYDREGKKDEAIEQFVKIEELNPENEEVKKVLANLREGKSALEGIVPTVPPIAPITGEQPEELE